MSRIDELIADLCPDGIEFRRISDISSKGSKIKWAQVGDAEYKYIDLGAVEPRTRQIGETQIINSSNAPSRAQQIVHSGDIIFATTRPTQLRWAVIPHLYDGQVVSTGYCVIRPDSSSIITNYLAHTLGTSNFLQYLKTNQILGNYPSIPDSRIQECRIPVPPLEVQREIVRILDKFTQLEAALEAELAARRKQYEYYRDQLLTFSEKTTIPRLPIGEVALIVRGASPRPIRKFLTTDKSGVPWIKIGDVAATDKYITTTAERITNAGATKSRRVQPGDFVLSNSMSFGRPFIVKTEGCVHDGWLVISNFDKSFVPDFLYHLLRSQPIQEEFVRRVGSGGAVSNLNSDVVKALSVPIPPLREQHRIAQILDKFDSLVNDLSIGLPAELAARRKQYEYYRDRLLTFEEKR